MICKAAKLFKAIFNYCVIVTLVDKDNKDINF